MSLTVDERYSSLVSDLDVIVSKLKTFLDGSETDVIQLNSGTIKSLSGILKTLSSSKYSQKVIDQRLYSDITVNITQIPVGSLVRVWGDTDQLNGLYRIDSTSSFVKISYQDIYDLGNSYASPKNSRVIHLDKTRFTHDSSILKFSIPVTSSDVISKVLKVRTHIICDEISHKGSYYVDSLIHVTPFAGTSNHDVKLSNVSTNSIDVNFASDIKPYFTVSVATDALNHTYTLNLKPLLDSTGTTIIPSNVTLTFEDVDQSFFKFIVV